jgi:hypothetical protein
MIEALDEYLYHSMKEGIIANILFNPIQGRLT